MLSCKNINNCCKDEPHISSNECYNYTNLKTTIHVLTPKSAGRWPTRKLYKNRLLFRK